ncbi:MAG: hypothetical protein Q8P13_02020 [bacterium]|nr:hypothetical protein [bacterium]
MINPTILRIGSSSYDLVRKFPGKGKASVKVGDSVAAADIVAHCEVSAGQRLVKVAHSLGVGAREVEKYLIRSVGDRIYQGEVIARRTGVLGLGKKEVKSPADGLIFGVDVNGDLIIKFMPTSIRLAAGASGKVTDVSEDGVTISTNVTEVAAPIASGKERDGALKVVGSHNDFLLPQHIDASASGKIIVGGALVERATIEKALTVGVHGIVVGGINYRDFLSLGVGSDVGLTVLVTCGYGAFPMGEDIHDKLKALEGYFAFISGEKAKLVIPDLNAKTTKANQPSVESWKKLGVGDKVRVLHEKEEKLLGKVLELKENQVLPSTVIAETALVELTDGKKVEVAAANLQIVFS